MGNGVLRDVRDNFFGAVPQPYDILDERRCHLFLQNMLATFRQNLKSEQGSR